MLVFWGVAKMILWDGHGPKQSDVFRDIHCEMVSCSKLSSKNFSVFAPPKNGPGLFQWGKTFESTIDFQGNVGMS